MYSSNSLQGKVLGDNSWDGFDLKDGTLMMMIGSGDAVPPPPPARCLDESSDGMEAEVISLSTFLCSTQAWEFLNPS